LIHKGKRYLFVDAETTVYGASIEGIANKLGRGKATVQRRLSTQYRAKLNARNEAKGIQPVEVINRIQIAQQSELSPGQLNNLKSELYFEPGLLKLFVSAGTVFKVCPNLYDLAVQLHRTGRINRRIACARQ
jgi:hypothetical protein